MRTFMPDLSQVAEFADRGFLLVRALFNRAEMSDLLAIARTDVQLKGESYVRKDAQGGATRLALRNDLDDGSVYSAIVRCQNVAGAMAALLGDEVYHYHHKMMLKEPLVGGAWEWHSGPHSEWFWDTELSGGGAIIDLGCHCVEIGRNFIGKDIKPVEVMCWGETQVHPIEAEDHAIGLVRYENGAIGQFEVSWCFRGGMDLRDEIAGTEGTIWLNHWLRTGMELYTAAEQGGYVAEKAEDTRGWLFPVGDETAALGYADMFTDMFDALEQRREPRETLYDGYVVNAIIDAAYASIKNRQWQPVQLPIWRGQTRVTDVSVVRDFDADHVLLKQEQMADGSTKFILRDKRTGKIRHRTG